jgi:hypothetical protein
MISILTASDFNCIPGLPILLFRDHCQLADHRDHATSSTNAPHERLRASRQHRQRRVARRRSRFHIQPRFFIFYGDPDFGLFNMVHGAARARSVVATVYSFFLIMTCVG